MMHKKIPMMIRKAKPRDTAELLRLCAAHAAFEGFATAIKATAPKLRSLLFAPSPRLLCLVLARSVGNSAGLGGYATLSFEVSTWNAESYLHLDCLYLDQDIRGLGYGRIMVDAIARYAQSRGISEIQWQTPVTNEAAIHFYSALGATSSAKVRFHLNGKEFLRHSSVASSVKHCNDTNFRPP